MTQPLHRDITAHSDVAATNRRALHLTALVVCAILLAAGRILHAEAESISLAGFAWPFRCWLHETLGVRCALCGMSRSFSCMAHGDLAGSLGYHAVGPALFALVCVQIPYRTYALAIHPQRIGTGLVVTQRALAAVVTTVILLHWLLYLGGLMP